MNQIEIVKFSQIVDQLPNDCWAKQRNEKRSGEFDNEVVLHIKGDAAFPTLDLDEVRNSVPVEAPDDARIFLILVEGNLTVETWVGNKNTDGATTLIVKGDWRAGNAILGGQQVYVSGNVSIEDILWGDYNHGDLIVCGTTSAGLFVATNQYHFDLRGERRFGRQLIEEGRGGGDWDLMDFETLSKLIEPDCLLDDACLDHVALMRDVVLDRLKSDQTVLLKEGVTDEPTVTPSLFEDRNITIDNILKIADPKRMPADLEGGSAPRLEFWTGDTLCRATAVGREDEFGAQRLVYLQDDTHALLFTVVLDEDPRSLWQKFSGKPATGAWRMSFKGRRFHTDGDEDWHVFETEPRIEGGRAFPEEFHPLLATGWNALLDGISTYDHAETLVDPNEIRRFLALPVVEPYDDFYGDTCGFWYGKLFCSFRQDGALFDDKPQPALLCVNRKYTHVDGRDLVEMYFFSIRRQFDGTESVFITYKDDQDRDAEQRPLSFLGGPHLELARRAFNAARRNLDAANRELIESGIPPDWEDGFAVKHWRKKGLIRRPAPSAPDRKFAFIEKAQADEAVGASDAGDDTSALDTLLQRIGWHAPELSAWQIGIVIATRPPIEWTTKRNTLQADDMWLSLTLSSFWQWRVQLKRHDGLFVVDWADRGVTVESQQLRYRKIMKWPEIAGPDDFPRLVGELNALFPKPFAREALVTILKTDDAVKEALADWLSDVCDKIKFIGDDE